MRPISGPAFERLLRSAEPAAFRQFVADLWAARGWQTTVDAEVVVATRDTSRSQRILVRHSAEPAEPAPNSDIDCLVADTSNPARLERAPPGVRVFGAADLRDMLWYGMDREAADELVRRFFGRPLTRQQTSGLSLRELIRSPATTPASASKALAVLVLVFLLASTLAGGPAGLAVHSGGTSSGSPTASDVERGATPTFRPLAPGTVNAAVLPPGIGPAGITDTRAVTGATAAALANRSYRWELTSRTTVDGVETGASRQVVTVNRPIVYAVTIHRPYGSGSGEIVEGAYADGRTHIERFVKDGGTTYCARPVPTSGSAADSYAARIEERLAWLLTARTSELTGTTTRNDTMIYRVQLSSDRWSDIEEQNTTVYIDADGVVRELRMTYTSSRSAIRKTVVVEHRLEFGVAAVPSPPWYSVARAVTDPTTESC